MFVIGKNMMKILRTGGSLTIWFSEEAIASWNSVRPSKMKRGRQQKYSDLAIDRYKPGSL
jgi:hypothetical protein